MSKIHMESRIIPLNKCHPNLPHYSRYRPIIVSSFVVKYLERLIMSSIQKKSKNYIAKSQFAFTKGVSID
jgi:hypothetical protein